MTPFRLGTFKLVYLLALECGPNGCPSCCCSYIYSNGSACTHYRFSLLLLRPSQMTHESIDQSIDQSNERTLRSRTGVAKGGLPWRSNSVSSHLRAFVSKKQGEVPYPLVRCLELGCGTGENVSFLFDHSTLAVGLDIVPAAIAYAKSHFYKNRGGKQTVFLCADLLGTEDKLHARIAAAEPRARVGCNVPPECLRLKSSGKNSIAAQVSTTETSSSSLVKRRKMTGKRWRSDRDDNNNNGPRVAFDFIFDCQTFHCLHGLDREKAARNYASLLRPGGTLLMLTGNADEEVDRGPVRLTKEEVMHAFDLDQQSYSSTEEQRQLPTISPVSPRKRARSVGQALELVSIEATYFDWTVGASKQEYPRSPLAWLSLWVKR